MAQTSSRFISYERLSQKVQVEDLVLFGDKMDVKIEKAKELGPTPSEGGTIVFKLRPTTRACPGIYYHSKVKVAEDPSYKSQDDRWLNLIHHEKVNGEAVGKYLCSVSGHSDFNKDNVWNRYDWCHHRNWGGDEEESDKEFEDEEELEDYDKEPKEDEDRGKIFFVPVNKKGENISEIGRITMGSECIEGDWNYGLRLVDSNTNLAYAYVFGDVLVNDELSGNGDWPDSDFCRPMATFSL